MPTLQQIGDLCGVSKATVSLALRGHPRIPEATREKIRQAALKADYRMNPLVSAHAAYVRTARRPKSATVLGYLTNWQKNALPASKHVNRLSFAGASKRAAELGYRLDQFQILEPGMTEQRLSQILAARGILGVLIADLARATKQLDLDWKNLACVAMGYGMRSPQVHRVCHDQYSSMRLLLADLQKLGYRRIGLAMEHRQDERADNLILAALLAHRRQHRDNKRIEPLLPEAWNRREFLKWYHRHRPDVVVSVLDDVVGWLRDDGVDVPGDAGFASVCTFTQETSGIVQHFEVIGAAAVDMLVGQLHVNSRGIPEHPQSSLILGSWNPGATVRQVK
jgi:LacI family transcriptional regulator